MVANALAHDSSRNRERLTRQVLVQLFHHGHPNWESIFGTRMTGTQSTRAVGTNPHAHRVLLGKADGIITGSYGICHGFRKNEDSQEADNTDADASPEAEAGGPFCGMIVTFAETAGDERGSSDTEQHTDRHKEQKDRCGQRYRSNHQRIICLTDEDSVRQVVEQDHQHTDDGWYDIGEDGFRNRCVPEELHGFLVVIHLIILSIR